MGTLDLTIGCLLIASWANMPHHPSGRSVRLSHHLLENSSVTQNLQDIQIFREISQRLHTMFHNIGTGCLSFGSHDCLCVFVGEILVPGNSLGQRSKLLTKVTIPSSDRFTRKTYIKSQTKQWIWPPLIALFIFTGLVGAGATASQVFINPSYTGRDAVVRYVTIWLSGSAAVDVIITGVLVWTFRTLKTNFVNTTDQKQTMTIGRIYTLSMLANLNNRRLLVGQLQASVEMNSSIKFNSMGLHPPERNFESDGSMNSGLHNSYLDGRCSDIVQGKCALGIARENSA
ncbi:hypothetical protein B0H19DRAFT_1082875 [Mycena capillaripes]|nr:hypothetical protein B0H19DRAFT_1082875 [Mycena capillaripes]